MTMTTTHLWTGPQTVGVTDSELPSPPVRNYAAAATIAATEVSVRIREPALSAPRRITKEQWLVTLSKIRH